MTRIMMRSTSGSWIPKEDWPSQRSTVDPTDGGRSTPPGMPARVEVERRTLRTAATSRPGFASDSKRPSSSSMSYTSPSARSPSKSTLLRGSLSGCEYDQTANVASWRSHLVRTTEGADRHRRVRPASCALGSGTRDGWGRTRGRGAATPPFTGGSAGIGCRTRTSQPNPALAALVVPMNTTDAAERCGHSSVVATSPPATATSCAIPRPIVPTLPTAPTLSTMPKQPARRATRRGSLAGGHRSGGWAACCRRRPPGADPSCTTTGPS